MTMSHIRKKAIAGLKQGDSFTVSRTFTEQDTLAFADLSRDYNPVHFDDRFANAKAFRGRICHGLAVASLATEIGGQIGWLASGMNFRFKRPVYFGDTIDCFPYHHRNRRPQPSQSRSRLQESAERGRHRSPFDRDRPKLLGKTSHGGHDRR